VASARNRAILAALTAVVLCGAFALVWSRSVVWLLRPAGIGILFVPALVGLAGAFAFADESHNHKRLKSDQFWLLTAWLSAFLAFISNSVTSSIVFGLLPEWFKFRSTVVDVSTGVVAFVTVLFLVTSCMATMTIKNEPRSTFANFLGRATLTMNTVFGIAFVVLILSGSTSLRKTQMW
jgi:hypothetical protein